MAFPPRRRAGREIRECAYLIKLRVTITDIVLFVLGAVNVTAGDGMVVLLTIARVRLL
jgi:hypothetical protein